MSPRILTYALTMDSSGPCISHIALFRQNNLITWKGRPQCLHLNDDMGIKLIIIITKKSIVKLYFSRLRLFCVLQASKIVAYTN